MPFVVARVVQRYARSWSGRCNARSRGTCERGRTLARGGVGRDDEADDVAGVDGPQGQGGGWNSASARHFAICPSGRSSRALLTKQNEWRKRLDAKGGYATATASELGRQLIVQLQTVASLRKQLKEVRRLPPPQFSESQWEVAQALLEVLRTAAAQLEVVFRESGEVDFPALVQAAVNALCSRKSRASWHWRSTTDSASAGG